MVKKKKNTLDRIENQLDHADFLKNRQFLSWRLPNIQIDTSAILPDFKEQLDNGWGSIPIEFKKLKDSVYTAMKEVEEVFYKLKSITEETNPLRALEAIEHFEYKHGSEIQLKFLQQLYFEDFERTCYYHLEQLNMLKNDGILDNFLEIRKVLEDQVIPFLSDNLPFDSNTVHSIFLEFNCFDFSIIHISQELTKANDYWSISKELDRHGHMDIPISSYNGIKDISNTKFEFFWLPGRIHIEEKFKDNLKGFYEQTDFQLYHTCMQKMFYSKY